MHYLSCCVSEQDKKNILQGASGFTTAIWPSTFAGHSLILEALLKHYCRLNTYQVWSIFSKYSWRYNYKHNDRTFFGWLLDFFAHFVSTNCGFCTQFAWGFFETPFPPFFCVWCIPTTNLQNSPTKIVGSQKIREDYLQKFFHFPQVLSYSRLKLIKI